MTMAYMDCQNGISGDMTLGALLDLGLPIEQLEEGLKKLNLDGWHLHTEKVLRCGISGTRVVVHDHSHRHGHHRRSGHDQHGPEPEDWHDQHPEQHHHGHDHNHGHRSFREIAHLIEQSGLPTDVRDSAVEAFRRIGVVEADIHGTTLDRIHFHEIGAVDSIIDLVGAFLGFHLLGITRVESSVVSVGGGTIRVAHGMMPVPAPATVRLLEGVPIQAGPVTTAELTTPTGAAILSVLCERYGPLPSMTVAKVGYGAGTRDFPEHPNLLRIVVGGASREEQIPLVRQDIVVLTAEMDDINGECVGFALERLREAGALDALVESVQMKKERPGIRLQVLAPPERAHALAAMILRETSTLGVRWSPTMRYTLERRTIVVDTAYGPIRGKTAEWGDEVLRVAPEYEDLRTVALQSQQPIQRILEAFHQAIASRQ